MGDTIFVIHDSKRLRESALACLEPAGYDVTGAGDLGTARNRIEATAPALFLLQWRNAEETADKPSPSGERPATYTPPPTLPRESSRPNATSSS